MSNSFLTRLLATDAGAGALALRVPVGIIFIAHGAQKLFGWFGGYGLEGTGQFFGGLALVFGVLVRPAAAALAFAMLIAIFAVHFSKGFFLDKGGYEYALALFAASVSLLFTGGGRFSADAALAANNDAGR